VAVAFNSSSDRASTRQALEAEGANSMIFIVVKFTIRAERSHQWLSLIDDFTQATRHAAGNIFCEWSRNVDDPHQFIVVEGFESKEADEAHLNSDYFRAAMAWIPDVIVKAPEIVKTEVP
jgi:quinol monooxygenase YgiN